MYQIQSNLKNIESPTADRMCVHTVARWESEKIPYRCCNVKSADTLRRPAIAEPASAARWTPDLIPTPLQLPPP